MALLTIVPIAEGIGWLFGIGGAAKIALDSWPDDVDAPLEVTSAERKAAARFKNAAAAQACSTCPPPQCKENAEQREKLRNELKQRAKELREDKHNLFWDHRYTWNAHPDPLIGSWKGHEIQFEQVQRQLRKNLGLGKTMGCPEPDDDAYHWATRNAPTEPGEYLHVK